MTKWNKVLWQEGMFLCPQHFQANDRHFDTIISAEMQTVSPFSWGFQSLQIDYDLLKIGIFVIKHCIAKFPSGVWLNVPENTDIKAINLKEKSKIDVGQLTRVYLALPLSRLGETNVSYEGTDNDQSSVRSSIVSQEYFDENTGDQRRPISFKRYGAKLLLEDTDFTGYEYISVAAILRQANNEYLEVEEFVPPALRVNVSSWLRGSIQTLLHMLRIRARHLAFTFTEKDNNHIVSDFSNLFLLSVLNAGSELLDAIFNEGTAAPHLIYFQLRHLLGQLSVFSKARIPPPLPAYTHDNIGIVFGSLITELEAVLADFSKAPYVRIPFVRHTLGMMALIRSEVAREDIKLFIGLDMPGAKKEEIDSVIERIQGKLLPASLVEEFMNKEVEGLDLCDVELPAALPEKLGRIYLEIKKENQYWEKILEDKKILILYSSDNDQLQILEDINLSLYVV